MKNYFKLIYLIIICVIYFNSCDKKPETKEKETYIQETPVQKSQAQEIVYSGKKYEGNLFANPIIYEVLIKADEVDNDWTKECLKDVDNEAFMELIFKLVYDNKLVPYDFISGEKLLEENIKTIEQEVGLENFVQLQFKENWYFDEENLSFNKQVLSFVIGYRKYDADGNPVGYYPAFKIKLSPEKANEANSTEVVAK